MPTGAIAAFGILSCAAYIPRWRLSGETIAAATGWARGMGNPPKGQRSFANWDEDSITMAVEAGSRAVKRIAPDQRPGSVDSLLLASTTLPFADRSNAGLVLEALNLDAESSPSDLTGSRRAATSALLSLFHRGGGMHLLCASDCVDTQPGSEAEGGTGHGAAALLLGRGKPVATLRASSSVHEDFVDQYRMFGQRFDYRLEPRWVRDAGLLQILESQVSRVLEAAGAEAKDIDWLLGADPGLNRAVATACGLGRARTADELFERIGSCGAAQPLVLLTLALEQAEAGENILLIGSGQGFDVLLLEVQGKPERDRATLSDCLQDTRIEDNYTRYLGIRQLLQMDAGIRSERDNRTAMSAFYRRHRDLTGFNGGLCSNCGKLQFPRSRYCVHCQARGSQVATPMAELDGEINSFTEDWLAYAARPPLMFGNVHFPRGANVMMEFSDFLPGELKTGQKVKMSFRIKDFDPRRNFRRYFWKPTPMPGSSADG